jgi:uncharacterized membrane protein
MLKQLRNTFFTGLFILLPILVSVLILLWGFRTADSIFGNFLNYQVKQLLKIQQDLPGLGIVALLLLIMSIGFLGRVYLGKKLIAVSEVFFGKIPIFKGVYGITKQITGILAQTGENAFRKVVLIEYPRAGVYSPGFLVGDAPAEFEGKTSQNLSAVFIPNAPNPTNGFLVFVPESEITILDMSVEDGFKLLISAGVIKPESIIVKK